MKRFFLSAFIFLTLSADAQIITTIAGSNDTALGDGSLAVNASLDGPYDVALDGKGNFYITDGYHNRIRKVDTAGIITTIAGTGTQGYNGDGMSATAAELYRPAGITFDHSGNLYFCDAYNNRVRKIDTAGIITTIAGNGTTAYNGDNILADSAAINDPHCVALDADGNLYVTDWGNHRIRKVNIAGTITTIAGTGVAGNTGDNGPADIAEINTPYGIVLDDTGNIYFTDDFEEVVRKINTSGIITTFAGGGLALGDNGPADSANLNGPAFLAIDWSNNIYIAEIDNQRIRKITAATDIITTIAGNGILGLSGDNGPATSAELATPTGVAIDATGNLYIADFGNDLIRRVGWPLFVAEMSALAQTIIIYPNPATTNLTILSTNHLINQIVISNLSGQSIFTQYYDTERVQVNVADMPDGVYFIEINGSEIRKFVKQ